MPYPDQVSDSSLDEIRRRLNTVRGLRWVFIGDSIVNGSTASNFAYSFMPEALMMVGSLNGRIDSVEAGTASQSTSQILARMTTAYSGYADLGGTVIMAGTNDAQSTPLAVTAQNLAAMILTAKAYGPVIVCTIPPRGAGASAAVKTATDKINLWIKTYGPGLGAEIADCAQSLVDTTLGTMLAAYNAGDDVHPNTLGHSRMAVEVARAIKRVVGRTVPYGLLTSVLQATDLLTPDPLSTSAGTKPTSWFEQGGGTGTAPTYSIVADTFGILPAGRWAQMDFDGTASGGTRIEACATSANWVVGDVLALVGHFQCEDVSGTWPTDVTPGTCAISPVLTNQSGTSISSPAPLQRCPGIPNATNSAVYDIGPVVWPVTVPVGTTAVNFWVQVIVPTGKRIKMRMGCMGVLNLTNMGLSATIGAWGSAPVNT